MYGCIEHLSYMCMRSNAVQWSCQPWNTCWYKKKKYVSNKVQDVHVVSVSPNVNGDSSWKAQLFDIIVCVTWSWHPLQTILIAMLPSHSNFSHFIHCKIKTLHTHLSKGCGEICTHVYTFIIFQFIGWKKYRV